jgi:hypothetical protein
MPGAPSRRARLWPSGWNLQSDGTANPTGGVGLAGVMVRGAPRDEIGMAAPAGGPYSPTTW